MNSHFRGRTGSVPASRYDEPVPVQQARVRKVVALTTAAQNHVVRNGLRPRLAVLMEQIDGMEGMMVGDRIALSDTPNLDLYLMRRRFVVDLRETTLEMVLDIAQNI